MSIDKITPLTPLPPLAPLNEAQINQTPGHADFGTLLKEAIRAVDDLQKQGEAASIGLATGQVQDVHTAVIALEKASLSLALTVEIRNKVIDAYNEIMRMQI